jgi:hypothetical protein
MPDSLTPPYEGDIPWNELSAPAQRALSGAGYFWLADLAGVSEAEVKRLHGIGPRALNTLRSALEARGLSFSGPQA